MLKLLNITCVRVYNFWLLTQYFTCKGQECVLPTRKFTINLMAH